MITSFSFLGNRNYINGLTIFETFIDYCLKHNIAIYKIESFKLLSFISTNCRIIISESFDKSIATKVSAMMTISTALKQKVTILLLEIKHNPIEHREEEYDRNKYVDYVNDISNKKSVAKLINVAKFHSLVRGIIEVNYRYCNEKLFLPGVILKSNWAYMLNLVYINLATTGISECLVEFTNKKMLETKERIFFIREFKILSINLNSISELCFFIKKSEGVDFDKSKI